MATIPTEVPAGATPLGEAPTLTMWYAERCVWTDRMLTCLRNGGPTGGKWYILNDKVFRRDTLRAAYARVARNAGAPGVDGVTVQAFGERLDEEIDRLLAAWQTDSLRPQAIRRKWIAKPGSREQRPLGIPTVRDRVVQAAIVMVLEPIFEMDFHACSYGFRPGRSAKGALGAFSQALREGLTWVVDADLKSYFDTIPHEPLLAAVRLRVTDRRLLHLIRGYLQAGIMDGGTIEEPESGTPQGGVLSPLLANLYLNDLDHDLAAEGYRMTRYADDFVICCATQSQAEKALARVKEWTTKAGLALHPEKTRLVDMSQHGSYVDFLGYRFRRSISERTGRSQIYRDIRPKSLKRIKDTIRQITRRCNAASMAVIIARLNQCLRGWFGYYRSTLASIHHQVDQMVRRRLRAILAKRHKHPCWGGGICQEKWPNAYFTQYGLLSLQAAHREYRQSCSRPR